MRHALTLLVVGLASPVVSCSGSGDTRAVTTIASSTTTEAVAILPAITRVPDPCPGDLREDEGADLLPGAYAVSAPASIPTDVAYGAHRGAPEHRFPAAVQDVKRAIRWLKQESVPAGRVNGEQVVLFGASSGGQLAALVAATPGRIEPDGPDPDQVAFDSTVVALVSLAGPADFRTMFPDPHPWVADAVESWLGCSPCGDGKLIEASPITYVDHDVPPAYWAYGGADPLVPPAQGLAIAQRWGESAGADNSWFDLVDGRGHNLDHSMINQRHLERFVDRAIDRAGDAP